MNNKLQDWPEPIVRVQSLSESGISSIPPQYIKPPSLRALTTNPSFNHDQQWNIPIIDLSDLDNQSRRETTLKKIGVACRDWGFFQIINHGVSPELMDRALRTWRDFFNLPLEEKQVYANSPKTYEGYGSRLGIQKNAILDWSDYFYLHYLPLCSKDVNKWPSLPPSCREVLDEYGKQLVQLSERLMKILSINLRLDEDYLQNAFGGNDIGACLRVSFYPKCPQPELALGLSAHSDPGGLTLLLPDNQVDGLQVRKDDMWITVKPVKHAFIFNVGDQIQVLSNAIYKSVEHRVMANQISERLSLAFFCNPKSDKLIAPAEDLVTDESPALYQPMTYDEYRLFIRMRGPQGKLQVESLKSPR